RAGCNARLESNHEQLERLDRSLQPGQGGADLGERFALVRGGLEQNGLQIPVQEALRSDQRVEAALDLTEPIDGPVRGGWRIERDGAAVLQAGEHAQLREAGAQLFADGQREGVPAV